MAPTTDAAIHQTLGALVEAVKNIGAELHAIKAEMQRSEDKSDASRAAVHRRMDELVTRVSSLEASTADAVDDIKTMKPTIDDVKRWKLMGIGALGVVGLGGAAVGVTLAGAVQKIAHFIAGQ
jgi:uncharacterized protein YukE